MEHINNLNDLAPVGLGFVVDEELHNFIFMLLYIYDLSAYNLCEYILQMNTSNQKSMAPLGYTP